MQVVDNLLSFHLDKFAPHESTLVKNHLPIGANCMNQILLGHYNSRLKDFAVFFQILQ